MVIKRYSFRFSPSSCGRGSLYPHYRASSPVLPGDGQGARLLMSEEFLLELPSALHGSLFSPPSDRCLVCLGFVCLLPLRHVLCTMCRSWVVQVFMSPQRDLWNKRKCVTWLHPRNGDEPVVGGGHTLFFRP